LSQALASERLTAPNSGVAAKSKARGPWPFGRKFDLWLADHGTSVSAFAERVGIPQSSLQRYAREGRKIPPDRLKLESES
jgi:hypothetical protein